MKKLVISFGEIENHFSEENMVFDEVTGLIIWDIIVDYILDEFNWDFHETFDQYDIDWSNGEIHLTFK